MSSNLMFILLIAYFTTATVAAIIITIWYGVQRKDIWKTGDIVMRYTYGLPITLVVGIFWLFWLLGNKLSIFFNSKERKKENGKNKRNSRKKKK